MNSIADRVRVRAVCKPWRSNSLQPFPLPFMWLTLPDGTFISIPGGEIHHMLLPDATACCPCSIDDWLFLMSTDGACSLVNPFSKSILQLPDLAKVWKRGTSNPYSRISPIFYKLVVRSSHLDSAPDSLVAALIMDDVLHFVLTSHRLPPTCLCSVDLHHVWAQRLCPDRGRPTVHWLVDPCRLCYIKWWGTVILGTRLSRAATHPTEMTHRLGLAQYRREAPRHNSLTHPPPSPCQRRRVRPPRERR
jgi:hypothetical protein